MRLPALVLAAAALAACATAPPPHTIVQPRPPLDQSLAAPCALPDPPVDLSDYDAVDDWVMHHVLPAFADCSRRLAGIVKAWGQARP